MASPMKQPKGKSASRGGLAPSKSTSLGVAPQALNRMPAKAQANKIASQAKKK